MVEKCHSLRKIKIFFGKVRARSVKDDAKVNSFLCLKWDAYAAAFCAQFAIFEDEETPVLFERYKVAEFGKSDAPDLVFFDVYAFVAKLVSSESVTVQGAGIGGSCKKDDVKPGKICVFFMVFADGKKVIDIVFIKRGLHVFSL